jgi:alkaline phosphatase
MNSKLCSPFLTALLSLALLLLTGTGTVSPAVATPGQADDQQGLPKNIIVLISDGCGYNQVDAASLYEHGRTGVQVYEQFPLRVAMSTFSMRADGSGGFVVGEYDPAAAWSDPAYLLRGYTDSAASGTAMSTGHKTYDGAIGVDTQRQPLVHAWQLAEQQGKMTGLVTSVQWSHATPGSFAAHNVSRNNYAEIASELILQSGIDVIMGCGHPWYDNDGRRTKTAKTFKYVGGEEVWNGLVSGTAGSDADGDGEDDPWQLIQTRDQFRALAAGVTPQRVCGVAQVAQTLQQRRSGDTQVPYAAPLIESVPTLAEMASAALNVLDQDPDGFCLMVEGGAVDWAGHDNQSGRVIEEQIAMNRMVEAVVDWVEQHSSWDETLLVVTADHETGCLTTVVEQAADNQNDSRIPDPSRPLKNNGRGQVPGMQWHSDQHTNSLVPFYARGAGLHLLRPLADQQDPRRGSYLDNAELGGALTAILAPSRQHAAAAH